MNKFFFALTGSILLMLTSLVVGKVHAQIITVSLNPTQDAFLSSELPTTNYGIDTVLHTIYHPSFGVYRSALKFDLGSIPANAVVVSAELRLKQYDYGVPVGSYTTHVLERFSSSWTETAINFSNQPSVIGGGITVSSGDGIHRLFDVLNDVEDIVDGTFSNDGWLLRLADETNVFIEGYHSKESAGSSASYPTLTIQYYLPIQIASASISHASNSSLSNGGVTPTIAGGSGVFNYVWTDGQTGSVISTSSSLSGVEYGWYGLHVTDDVSGLETYMAFIVGAECEVVSIDFKPGPEYVDDAMISDLIRNGIDYGDINYGSYSRIMASNWTYGSWYDVKSLLKFFLWIDSGVTLDLANLNLMGYDHSPLSRPNQSEIRYISSDWSENDVTFNSAPGYSATPIQLISGTSTTTENKIVNTLDFWDLWKANNSQNYGMMFQLQSYINSYTRIDFHSSDATTISDRPWIEFEVNLTESSACRVYAKMERKLRGVKYKPVNDKLNFYVSEEYDTQSGNLNYSVYADGDRLSPVLTGISQPETVDFGDNRYQITVGSLQTGSYILEVVNDKKEKFYLRFII